MPPEYPDMPQTGTPGPTCCQAQLDAKGLHGGPEIPPHPPSPQHDEYSPNLIILPKRDQLDQSAPQYPAASLSGNLFAHEDVHREIAHHLVPNAFLDNSQYVRPETHIEGWTVWFSEGNRQGPGRQDVPAFRSLWQDLQRQNPKSDHAILLLVTKRELDLLATLPFKSMARVLREEEVDLCRPLFKDPNDPLTASVGLLKGNLAYRLGKGQATTIILGLGTSLCDPTIGFPSKESSECVITLVANNYLHLLRTMLVDVGPADLSLINIILLGPVPIGNLDIICSAAPLAKGIFQRLHRSPGDAEFLKRVYPILTGKLVELLLCRANLEEFPLQYQEGSGIYTSVAAYSPEFLEMLNKHIYYRILLFAVGRRAGAEDAWLKTLSDPAELRRSKPFPSTQLTVVNFDNTPQALGITTRRKPRKNAYTVTRDDVGTYPHLQHHNYVLGLRVPTPCPGYGIYNYDSLVLRMASRHQGPPTTSLSSQDGLPGPTRGPAPSKKKKKKGANRAGPPLETPGTQGHQGPPTQPSASFSEPGGSPTPSFNGHSSASVLSQTPGALSLPPNNRGSYRGRGRRPWGQRPRRGRHDAAPRQSRRGHHHNNKRGRNAKPSSRLQGTPAHHNIQAHTPPQATGTSYQQPQDSPQSFSALNYHSNPTSAKNTCPTNLYL